ncbi:MAG TPA: hypothetical protein VK824_03140 [Planctomycetota bacterium]|nr:hypothetical protein [Planctomycetota bacterium]
MQLLRFGTMGLFLLASFAAPARAADQPLDEPAPFGVIQFSPDEAWIDLPSALGDAWSATLAVLTELKYDVQLDAAYVATGGQLKVADLWVAVEPHGTREKSFTRIRVALDRSSDEYTQARAEVILDAVATRLAPAPAPTPATQPQYAEQPADPGVEDVYTGAPVATDSYAYSTAAPVVYNTYNTYNYAAYPTPYYANYGYYAPFGTYFPYTSCWNSHFGCGGWYGGKWCSPYFNSWACGPTFTYWNCPSWGFNFGFGCNPWWSFGFSGGWGNACSSIGFPWNSWGNCGGSLVVTTPDPKPGNGGNGGTGGKGGKGIGVGSLVSVGSAKPVKHGKPVLGTGGSGVPVSGIPSTGMTRGGAIPRIQVTHRERNESGTRFDPRTTVTRTVDTHTVDRDADASTRGALGTPDITRQPVASSLPRVTDSASVPHGRAQPGKVVRMSSPSFKPGFVGVTPGAARPVSTVDGTTGSASAPYGTSHGVGNPYAAAPAPAVHSAPASAPPVAAPVFSAPGSVTTYHPAAPSSPGPAPAPRSSAPSYAPPPVAAPRVSAPMPAPVSRPPSVSAPAPSMGGGGSMGGGSAGHSGGGQGGPSGGGSSKGGGRGRP